MEAYNNELLKKYVEYLSGCRYSYSTINAYKQYINDYLTKLNKPVCEVEEIKVTCYLANNILDVYRTYYARDRFVEAFILFFKHIIGKDYTMFGIAGKCYESKLPKTLTRSDIKQIIDSTSNLKHKTILSLIYFLGLRLEELINIKLSDIDMHNNEIIIRNPKKNNERIVRTPQNLNNLLNEYLKLHQPNEWLFEGRKNKKYCTRGVQLLVNRSLEKCHIEQKASPTTIRHSLATHLLEEGTDLYLIQDYLGLNSAKYAKKYTQIAKSHKFDLSKAIEKGL